MTAQISPDGKTRCFGYREGQELYAAYHDQEWGIPKYEDQVLFEMLVLEGAQAGLSWETILKKRDHYRTLFHQFDVQKVARMSDEDLEERLQNPGIIRNRLKVYSARKNARAFMEIQKEFETFSNYLWAYVNYRPIKNAFKTFDELPSETNISRKISKDLKSRGMSFVGPTIIYAYMQSIGMVDDHLANCWCTKK